MTEYIPNNLYNLYNLRLVMKNDLEFRGVLAMMMVQRLQELGIPYSTFERCEGMAHNTFQNI